MRNLEVKPNKVANLLEKGDDLGIEVDSEFQRISCRPVSNNIEESSRDCDMASLNILQP